MATDTLASPVFTSAAGADRRERTRSMDLPANLESSVLSIVIPALNEESTASTVQRCVAARDPVCEVGRVKDIEAVVVGDRAIVDLWKEQILRRNGFTSSRQ